MRLLLSPGNNHLKKKVLESGEGRDSRPQKGQNVKINLKTYLKDGTLVEEQSDLSFTLGDGDVIQVMIHNLTCFFERSDFAFSQQVMYNLLHPAHGS